MRGRTVSSAVDSRVIASLNLMLLRLITISEVLLERKQRFPKGVDIDSLIPSLECSSTATALLRRTYLWLLPVRSVKYNGRTCSKVIASDLRQVIKRIDELTPNPKALQKFVIERKRITQAIYKVRVSTDVITGITCLSKLQSRKNINAWLRDSTQLREHSIEELMKDRRTRYQWQFVLPLFPPLIFRLA